MQVLVLGPAASGKTMIIHRFGKYLEADHGVRYVNLDPGVEGVPYAPDFDIRDSFTLAGIMRDRELGPNGAMLEAWDRLATIDLPKFGEDFVLLDTPGQLESFVFRDAGHELVKRLLNCVCLFILDASSPLQTLPSLLLYSMAAQFSLGVPTVNVMNKSDLLGPNRKMVVEFLRDPRSLLKVDEVGMRWEVNTRMAEMLENYLPSQRPCLVSASTGDGFDELLDMVEELGCACGDMT
jgi:GTPase SAR1 family protein